MTKIKAVLFDYDGTLRDSKSLIYEGIEHAFKANNLAVPSHEELAPHMHHHSFVHKALAPEVSYDDFEHELSAKVDELMPTVGLYPYVEDALVVLHNAGYRIGLVTAAKTATDDVKRLGIGEYFDVIVSGKDITKHKPDPEGINLALETLGIVANEAIYVGDMMTDMYAAQAAKLRACVGVTFGMANHRELETAGADYIINELIALPAVIEQIEL